MDITYETAPLALQILNQQIEGNPGNPMTGQSGNYGQKGLCMELLLQKETIAHVVESRGEDLPTNREYLALVKQEREANAILEWMLERKNALEEAIKKSESERDAAIAKAMGHKPKGK